MDKIVITGGATIEGGNLLGAVEYIQKANPAERLGIGFAVSARIAFKTTEPIGEGDELTFYTMFASDSGTYRQIGKFYAETPKIDGGVYTVTAYDAMYSKTLELTAASYTPLTAAETFTALCTAYNLTVGTIVGNTTVPVCTVNDSRLFTVREILGFLAAIMGGYAYVNASGAFCVRCLNTTTTSASLDPSKYVSARISDEARNSSFIISYQSNEGWKDFGAIDGELMRLAGNPYLCDTPATYSSAAVQQISSGLSSRIAAYYTGTVTLLDDYGINAGDCITVNGNRFLVFEKHITADGVVLSSSWAPVVPTSAGNIAELFGGKEDRHLMIKGSAAMAWRNEYRRGKQTTAITLPEPKNIGSDKLRYTFIGNGSAASFVAPSGWKLGITDFRNISAGNTVSFATTNNYIYVVDFEVIHDGYITYNKTVYMA